MKYGLHGYIEGKNQLSAGAGEQDAECKGKKSHCQNRKRMIRREFTAIATNQWLVDSFMLNIVIYRMETMQLDKVNSRISDARNQQNKFSKATSQ